MDITAVERPIQAPYVSGLPRGYMSSDFERIRKIRTRYNNAWNAKEWEFAQTIEAWKFYFGAIGEQWDEKAIKYRTQRHLRVAQYNIVRDKVRTMTGMLVADEYDTRYDPISSVRNTGIEAIENAYDCDKELMGYDYPYQEIVLDGMCEVGTLGLKISTDKDPRGNISFVRELPLRWVMDPDWVTNSIYDCMYAWKQGHMTAQQVLEMNPDMEKTPQLEAALKKSSESARNWTSPSFDNYDTAFPTIQDTFHVVEEHWIEKIKTKRLIGRTPDGMWLPFPVTKDNEELERFAMINGIDDWQDSVRVVPYEDRIAHLDRICLDLSPSKFLASGKPEIQVKSIPVVQFSYDKDWAGRNIGMVNDIMDPQKDLNYAKAKRQELLASAQGGAGVYNRQKMPDDTERSDFESNNNDPTRMFGIDGDPKGFLDRIGSVANNPELYRESEEPFSIVDRISGVSAAMSSRTQGSNEPASLFAMKLKINKVGTLPLDKRLQMVRTWMAQSYFLQAQISYKDMERSFTSMDGTKSATLNQRLPDGSILNKVDELPLCSVTISEAPGNLTRQLRDRTEISAMLEAIPKEYEEPIAIMINEAFKTMNLSADRKEMVEQAMNIIIMKARLNSMAQMAQAVAAGKGAETQTLQAQIASMQLEQQLKQMMMNVAAPQQQAELPQMVSKPPQGSSVSSRGASPGQTQAMRPEIQNPITEVSQNRTPMNQ